MNRIKKKSIAQRYRVKLIKDLIGNYSSENFSLPTIIKLAMTTDISTNLISDKLVPHKG